jgi:hypothetical protein
MERGTMKEQDEGFELCGGEAVSRGSVIASAARNS